MTTLIEFGSHPIAHRLLSRPGEPEYRHPVTLGCCTSCRLAQLIDPIPPAELYTEYHWLSSWKWNPHASRLADLIETHLPDKSSSILEVASNDGSFLRELQKRGYRKILGLEPARDACEVARRNGLETIHGFFEPTVAARVLRENGPFDLLIARQVLEHVSGLGQFRDALRVVLVPGNLVLFEVPNFAFTLRAIDFSALWEEHVNQFTLDTLSRFLRDAGIEVIGHEIADFCGEALIVLGRYDGKGSKLSGGGNEGVPQEVLDFVRQWPVFRSSFLHYLESERRRSGKIAFYGAGGRACCLINYLGLAPHLDCVIDDQPEKQGKFMPGSGLPILPRDALLQRSIGLCLMAVNAENERAVMAHNGAFLRCGGRFVSVNPPSRRLPEFWTSLIAAGRPSG